MLTKITSSIKSVASEYRCLSSDTKPTDNVPNASTLHEMDTDSKYMFDAESKQWIKTGQDKYLSSIYEDGSSAPAATTDYEYSDAQLIPLGSPITDVAVVYSEDDTIYTKQPISLAFYTELVIVTPPTKTEYTVGETFDATGMVVKAVFSDGTEDTVTTYTVAPSTALAATDTTVTLSYETNYETKTATQAITVQEA